MVRHAWTAMMALIASATSIIIIFSLWRALMLPWNARNATPTVSSVGRQEPAPAAIPSRRSMLVFSACSARIATQPRPGPRLNYAFTPFPSTMALTNKMTARPVIHRLISSILVQTVTPMMPHKSSSNTSAKISRQLTWFNVPDATPQVKARLL